MNEFQKELCNLLNKSNYEKLQSVKIGIAGAGGLGSNCAFNLVRSGFSKFKIIDFDKIDHTNLNRQFYFYSQTGMYKVAALKKNLLKINPDIDLEALSSTITKDNIETSFSDCDVVIEAFDKVEYKKLIVETYYNSNKLLVAASGIAGWGNSDDIKVRKVHSNFYLIGDLENEASKENPVISPRVNIAAAKQADVVLDWVINKKDVK